MTDRFLEVLSTKRQPAFVGKKNTYILQTVVGTEPLNLFPPPAGEYYKQTTVCRETTKYFLQTMEDKQ